MNFGADNEQGKCYAALPFVLCHFAFRDQVIQAAMAFTAR